jgi:hypothetical protein
METENPLSPSCTQKARPRHMTNIRRRNEDETCQSVRSHGLHRPRPCPIKGGTSTTASVTSPRSNGSPITDLNDGAVLGTRQGVRGSKTPHPRYRGGYGLK